MAFVSAAQRKWFWANFGSAARRANPVAVKGKIASVRAVVSRIGGPEIPLRKAAQRMADETKVPGSEADALAYAEKVAKPKVRNGMPQSSIQAGERGLDKGRGIPRGPSVFEITAEGLAAESAATRGGATAALQRMKDNEQAAAHKAYRMREPKRPAWYKKKRNPYD